MNWRNLDVSIKRREGDCVHSYIVTLSGQGYVGHGEAPHIGDAFENALKSLSEAIVECVLSERHDVR